MNENEQNRNPNSVASQGSQNNTEPSGPYMAGIQKVLDKLDEVKDDVRQNTNRFTGQPDRKGTGSHKEEQCGNSKAEG